MSIKETMNGFDFCYSITSLKIERKQKNQKKALDIADLILFHKMVRVFKSY